MNSRFKNIGVFGSKRTPSRNVSSGPQQPSTTTLAPSASSTNGLVNHTPPGSTSSTTSLPMNPPQNGLGRPPSYTYNPNAPRTQSPMPPQQPVTHHPPPISTGQYPQGHPALGGASQPPGYGGGYVQGQGMSAPQPTLGQYGGRGQAVEVEGAGRSKAQLIVGIDFVRKNILECIGFTLSSDSFQGTTFSGVAFAFATNTEAKEDIITEWPGAGNQTKQKVGSNSKTSS